MDIEPIKQDIVTASHVLHQQGIAAAFGHVSARIPGTDRFIFPPKMSPALVQIDNLLELDVDGRQLAGAGRPNTEFWIHARIYKARPDVQSVCHVHPPSCVVLSSLGETIRPLHASGAVFVGCRVCREQGHPTPCQQGVERHAASITEYAAGA